MPLTQQNILIADGTLTDLNVLLADLPTRMQVVRVTSAVQALTAFWQALATPGLRQLHVLAHGEPGAVAFAGQRLTAADFVRRFDGAAQRDLDLAFWSCRTGEGEAGKAFVHALAQATGARVAASERLIGNGYWALTPAIVPPFAIKAREAYEHTLPTQPSFISPAFYQDAERGEAAQSVNLGDLNEDGLVDIQAASRDMYGAENLTSTLLNDGGGTGTFTAVFNLPGAANGVSQHTRLADMNSDGHLDFVAMTTMPSKDLVISWGAGTGQYTAYAKPLNGVANLLAWDDFTVADVNGDGKMDLVLAGESNGQTTISVLTGTGNGAFASTPTSLAIETAGVNVVQHIEAADLNQDGYADLVTTRSDGRTSVSFGSANGLTLSQIYPSSSFNNTDGDALALADVNHDGKLDMISAIDSIQTVTVRLNQGNGTFGAATFNALNGLGMVTSLAVGDVNQDGNQDIVVATDMGSPQVLLNTGTGTFSTPVNLPGAVTGSVDVALGDVNQDGKLDVVTALMSGEVGVWLNSTTASDTTAPTFASASVNGATVVLTLNDANALDASATAPLSAYSVKVNGVAAALTGSPVVNASAKTITLTLATAVLPAQTVSVSYTDPSSSNDVNAVQDITGNDASSISNFAVSNQTTSGVYTLGVTQANYTASGSYNLDIIGNALNNSIAGNSGANLIDGGNGNDVLNGGNGNDTLLGGAGKDTLTGGLGVDSLAGGADNDIYYVDNSDDVISEDVTGGVDIVYASASYVLSANVEGLNLQGSANLSGTGNALANTMNGNTGDNMLTGLDGNDVLDGKQGADTLVGGQGSDTYYLDNAGDQIIELAGEGVDVVFTSVSYTMADNVENMRATAIGLTLVGNALNNLIYGSTGQDALIDGGAGNDIIYSQGNDMGATEIVHGGAGNDTIYVNGFTASGNYGSYVYGDDGNDTLDASVGDVQSGLYGGTGNDTYIINNLNNAVIEDSNAGIDTVKSSVTFSLQYGEFLVPNYGSLSTVSDDVENLTLTGTGNINGLGNALANYILGNTGSNLLQGRDGNDQLIGQGGDDTLEGGAGNDVLAPVTHTSSTGAPRVLTGQITLTGGAGSDVFWMTQGYVGDHSSGANTLNITDFVHGADKIKLTLGASVTLPTSVTTLTPGTGATLSSLLNQASSSATAATTPKVTVFSFSGDTYLVLDQSNATTFASGDLAIKLTGVQTVSFSDLAFVKM